MLDAIKTNGGSGRPTATELGRPSRRQVLRGVAVAGVAAATGGLTACGGRGSASGTGPPRASSSGTTSSAPSSSGTASNGASTNALAKTSDIPVGGGVIFRAEKIVVTQPTTGEFKAFSAICTHQACVVGRVADGIISCPCHGSRYSIDDGSVQGGPASRPLPGENIAVENDEIVLT
jgi:Rieske Fe-S protein